MKKVDFNTMTKAELRAYVIAHPDEKEAFYTFVDRFTSETSGETFSMPQSPADIAEIDRLIQQKVKQMK